jgi:hypothetical protein
MAWKSSGIDYMDGWYGLYGITKAGLWLPSVLGLYR